MEGDVMFSIFNVRIHSDEAGGYWAECPQLDGCFTQGETISETENNMYEAVALYLEDKPYFDYSLDFEVFNA